MVRQQPPRQAPPVMKLLVKYGKTGRLRFASHRDFARALERALRRAAIPMAFSSGFSPHPRVSYINPAATGVASVAEYLVVALAEAMDPADVQARLAAAMPDGFPVLEVVPFTDQRFGASLWEVELDVIGEPALQEAVDRYQAADTAPVTREVKTGPRTFDTKPAVLSLKVGPATHLTMLLAHGEPLVRPSDVVEALHLDLPPTTPPLYTRLGQSAIEAFFDPE